MKIKRFMDDKKPESTDILMGDYIVVEQLEAKDILFTKKLLLPADFNLSMLSCSMSPGQIINVRAMLMQLNEVETVNMPQGKLRKVDGLLVTHMVLQRLPSGKMILKKSKQVRHTNLKTLD